MANIELDGTNKKIKVDSGDLTLDIPGDIILDADGANVTFKDGGTSVLDLSNSSTDAVLTVSTQDKDLIIKGDDGGSAITALTLDMSAAGAATFNDKVIATELDISGNCDIDGTTNLDAVDVDGNVQIDGTVTVGVDDTGKDVKFFGASAGAYMEWDESADQLRIMGASADATTSTGKLLLATSLTNINANDVIGKIEFQAPHEAGGTDAITVAASIQAVAQSTFSSSSNATDLIFYTGHSEAAAEKIRITSQNEIGIAGANYGTDGQVLTSAGAGAAVAWEDAAGGGKVNQVLFMTTTTEVEVDTTSYTDTGLTQAITPSASDSRVLIMGMVAGQLLGGGVDKSYAAKILRDTTEIETQIIERYMKHDSDLAERMSQFFCFVDSPSTTSSVTYKVQVKGDNGGTIKVCLQSQPSNMTVMEILA